MSNKQVDYNCKHGSEFFLRLEVMI